MVSSHFEEATAGEFILYFIATHSSPILKTFQGKGIFRPHYSLCGGKEGYCMAINEGL